MAEHRSVIQAFSSAWGLIILAFHFNKFYLVFYVYHFHLDSILLLVTCIIAVVFRVLSPVDERFSIESCNFNLLTLRLVRYFGLTSYGCL